MKNLLAISTLFLTITFLTACGGGSDGGEKSTSAKLILDNGRGTTNGHDTEVPKRK